MAKHTSILLTSLGVTLPPVGGLGVHPDIASTPAFVPRFRLQEQALTTRSEMTWTRDIAGAGSKAPPFYSRRLQSAERWGGGVMAGFRFAPEPTQALSNTTNAAQLHYR